MFLKLSLEKILSVFSVIGIFMLLQWFFANQRQYCDHTATNAKTGRSF